MNIKDIRDNSDVYSSKLSEICRQLSFAGIAVVWIFIIGADSGGITYNGDISKPLGLFALALLSDLLQYLYATFVWTKLGDSMDKDRLEDKAVHASINLPTTVLFYTKVILVMIGYLLIVCNIWTQL